MALTFDLYQVEVRNRIAATSTFYGTIDGELYSQAIVDAIIANGNVLDPEVTASGDTGTRAGSSVGLDQEWGSRVRKWIESPSASS